MNQGKLIIGVFAIIIIVIASILAFVFVTRKLLKIGDKKKKNVRQKTDLGDTLELIPLRDICGDFAIMSDGRAISGIEVICKNRDLMTKEERIQDIRRVAAAIGPIGRPFAIICMKMRVDTAEDVRYYDREIEAADEILAHTKYDSGKAVERVRKYEGARKRRLEEWRKRAAARSDEGATKNAAFVFIAASSDAERESVRETLRTLGSRLIQSGYRVKPSFGKGYLDAAMAYQGALTLQHPAALSGGPVVPDVVSGSVEDGYEIYEEDDAYAVV